jgi:hypothetical protein
MAEREGEMRRNVSRLACSLLFVFAASTANANPIFAGFPAPGGTTFVGAGQAAGQTGGGTATWSGFNFSAFDQLWWGPTAVQLGAVGSISNLTLSGAFGGLTETWSGNVTLPNFPGSVTLAAQFTATIVSGASGWIDPSTVGIPTSGPNSAQAVAEITSGPFALLEKFEVNVGGVWTPFLNEYQVLSTNGIQSQMTVQGALWYTAVVPGPVVGAGLPGLVTAALAMVGLARRRRQLVA